MPAGAGRFSSAEHRLDERENDHELENAATDHCPGVSTAKKFCNVYLEGITANAVPSEAPQDRVQT